MKEQKLRQLIREQATQILQEKEAEPPEIARKLEGQTITAADAVRENEIMITLSNGTMINIRGGVDLFGHIN